MLLMHFGGIYLDNDVYLVNSLDRFRQFEMSLGLGNRERHTIGSQVLVAHKNARLLRAWFDTYRADYRQEEWYTNAGIFILEHSFIPSFNVNDIGLMKSISYLIRLISWANLKSAALLGSLRGWQVWRESTHAQPVQDRVAEVARDVYLPSTDQP